MIIYCSKIPAEFAIQRQTIPKELESDLGSKSAANSSAFDNKTA